MTDFQDEDYVEEEEGFAQEAIPRLSEVATTYPFDTAAIDITDSRTSVFNITQRIKSGEIDLAPEYQRHQDLWKIPQQSRLIESLLLGIPLQVIYFDAEYRTEDAKSGVRRQVWHVVDGVQRLSAIRNFILGSKDRKGNVRNLKLKGLEYLVQLNGMSYEELSPSLQRTIQEAIIPYYLIRPSTPEEIKFNIFNRVNTGGVPLTQQEIRHALFCGKGTRFLERLAGSQAFVRATNKKISSKRMLDQEFANRFLAFYLMDPGESYRTMDSFLNDALRMLNNMDDEQLEKIFDIYEKALGFITEQLGDRAFRRYMPDKKEWNKKINKAVFETLMVGVAKLSPNEREKLKVSCDMRQWYKGLFESLSEDSYTQSITASTGNRLKVIRRQALIVEEINKILKA